MKKSISHTSHYVKFLGDLKHRIAAARTKAAQAVNRDLIILYWDIGEGIVERQKKLRWGDAVIERLARDLQKAFPGTNGFSDRNLRNMKQLFLAYSTPTIWQQPVAKINTTKSGERRISFPEYVRRLVAEIPWGQHLLILNKINDPKARLFYLRGTAKLGWSRSVLLNQINADAFGRSLKNGKAHNFALALPDHLAEQADETLKSSYNLEFLGIGKAVREKELESRLIEKVRDFILELGYGFCFIGNQHRLTLGNKEYFIDLLFYHRFLKALVVVELKAGPFQPEYAGKMDFYLNLLNEKEKAEDDRPSIGIILCAEKDSLEVEFSLKTKKNPIGVAEYKLFPQLPKKLRGQLPSERQLLGVFKKGRGHKIAVS